MAHTPVISTLSSGMGTGAGGDTITIYGSDLVGSGDTAVLVSLGMRGGGGGGGAVEGSGDRACWGDVLMF